MWKKSLWKQHGISFLFAPRAYRRRIEVISNTFQICSEGLGGVFPRIIHAQITSDTFEVKKGRAVLAGFVVGRLFQGSERCCPCFLKSLYLVYFQLFMHVGGLNVCEGKNARMVHGASHHCSSALAPLFVGHWTMVRWSMQNASIMQGVKWRGNPTISFSHASAFIYSPWWWMRGVVNSLDLCVFI